MMKRIVSIALVLCLLLSVGMTSVLAEDGNRAVSHMKLSRTLIERMLQLPPDTRFSLGIWFDDSLPPFDKEIGDFSDINDYIAAQRAYVKEYHLSRNNAFAAQITEYVPVTVSYVFMFIPGISVIGTAEDALALTELDFIVYVDLLDAEVFDEPTEYGNLYEGEFAEWIGLPKYDPVLHGWDFGTYSGYEELFYHCFEQGSEPDWVLIKAHVELYSPVEDIMCKRIGRRVLVGWCPGSEKMVFELAVYDVVADQFRELEGISPDDYPAFAEALEAANQGYMVGDTDMDGEIDVTDATLVQRILLDIAPPQGEIYREAVSMIGDIDGDGLEISDATRIQRYLCGMGEL